MFVVFFIIFALFFILGMAMYVIWNKIARMVDDDQKKHERQEDINQAYHEIYKQEIKKKYEEEKK